jgi:hypothetical protein
VQGARLREIGLKFIHLVPLACNSRLIPQDLRALNLELFALPQELVKYRFWQVSCAPAKTQVSKRDLCCDAYFQDRADG